MSSCELLGVEPGCDLLDKAEKRIALLESALNRIGGSPPPGTVTFAMLAEAQERRIAELKRELIDHLYAQMLRCSEDAAMAYEVPGGGDEIIPECGTTCKIPLECPVYQRWLDLKGGA